MYCPPGEWYRCTYANPKGGTQPLAKGRETCNTYSMEKTQSTYRIIGYGETEKSFFNQFNFSSTIAGAEKEYRRLLEDCEMDGAVLIKVDHEEWSVLKECGTYLVSIVYTALGTFKVQKAPNYVIV